jgi:GNAT superfamily N-acetyltransferase
MVESLDSPNGRQLLGEFEAEIASLYPGWSPTSGPSAKPSEFVAPEGLFLVAYDGDEAIACGGYKQLTISDAEVKRLYVVPTRRGQGIAGALMEALESRAREAGYARVRLDTGDGQPGALQLYRARGYDEIADYNANPFASHWFEKRLA